MTTATSHGSPGSGAAVPPLRREVLVAAHRDLAFRVFTERIGAWWPLAEHSVHGRGSTVGFVEPGLGARIVETRAGAADATWGTVTRWEPGVAIAFTWHPGHGHDAASRVLVNFTEVDGGTLVTLEHSGWEAFGDRAAEARTSYENGWPVVLTAYAAGVTT